MRILVLGAGALGGYFGGKLLQGGSTVDFMVRARRAAQLAEHGLVVRTHEGEIRTQVNVVSPGEAPPDYDMVLLCCKAYDLEGAMTAITPAVGNSTAIMPVLNGVKHIDALVARFGVQRVLGGLTAVNATLLPSGEIIQSPVKIEMTAVGELDGRISDRCLAIQQAFAAGGMKVDVSNNILGPMWTKFVGFAAIATISTVCRARAGAIASASASSAFIDAVIDECSRVAVAEEHAPAANLKEVLRSLFSQPDSKYGPSILIDMEEGRTTEGEHTIGDMVERGRRKGLNVPLLTAALCNLQVYERTRVPA